MKNLGPGNNFKKLQDQYISKFIKSAQESEDMMERGNLINILSPGRVNIIGEHTDYNQGLSITAAINKYIFITGYKNGLDSVEVYSKYLDDSGKFSLNNITFDKSKHWINYIKGIVNEYIQRGYKISGFNMIMDSNLPIGAGISSSASLEVGVAKFIKELFKLNVSDKEIVNLSNSAENNFVGVSCGFMDQFSVTHGKKDYVIFLNFKDLSYEYIPFSPGNDLILIINSREERNLANTEYNKRRKECNDAVRLISGLIKGRDINSLSDISPELLLGVKDKLPEKIFKRARHVVTENKRVLLAKECLLKGDIEKLGSILYESHESLKNDYEVSTDKLDYLVQELSKINGVYGARLMGAGFGGSVISIVKKEIVGEIIDKAGTGFLRTFNNNPDFIECLPSDGTMRVNI
ncbi:MAG: galactokinase [Actinomycetota bacterium]|nr:galactokinase [Actinomycetota bacterium]